MNEDQQRLLLKKCCSEGLLPENYMDLIKQIATKFSVTYDEKKELTASLAEISVTEDILYLGLLSMDHTQHGWHHIQQLIKQIVAQQSERNVFARISEDMERACRITDILPIRSDWMLVRTVAAKIEANRLVSRIPGVTLHDVKPDNLNDLVTYDELIMNCKRHTYLNVMTKDVKAYSKFAKEKDAVCGFLVMQELKDGAALALHLVANDRHVAKLLLKKSQDEFAPAQKGIVLIMGSCCSPFVGDGMAKLCMHGLMLQYRGQGLGTLLADKAMEHIGDSNAYIVCIPEHEHIYLNKYQFNVSPRVFQVMGPCIPKLDNVIMSIPGLRVLESDRGVHEILMDYDTDVVGFNRSPFLERVMRCKNTMTRIAVREDDQIAGYGFIGDGVHGAAIVFHLSADTTDIAELLLGRLFRDFPGVSSRGVWAIGCIQNYETHNFFKKFNLKSIHESKLLRKRGVFDNDLARIYLYGACAVPFVGTDIAYLCLLGVTAQYRKRGIGTKLMESAMQHVGTHNVFLHCTPEQVHFFRDRWNFQLYIRELKSLGPGVPKTSKLAQAVPGVQAVELTPELLPLVVKYDEFVFGACRKKFVEASTSERDARTLVACRGPRRVCGYAFLTTNVTGHAIVRGIYADAEDIAELLLFSLLRDSPYSSTVSMVVQMKNSEELYFEQKTDLKRTNDIKTLFRWPIKNGDLTKIYTTAI
ncbi:unnamed protein product [Ixodes hexagonus]